MFNIAGSTEGFYRQKATVVQLPKLAAFTASTCTQGYHETCTFIVLFIRIDNFILSDNLSLSFFSVCSWFGAATLWQNQTRSEWRAETLLKHDNSLHAVLQCCLYNSRCCYCCCNVRPLTELPPPCSAESDENKFGRKLNHFIDNDDVMRAK